MHIDESMVKRLAAQTTLDLWPGWVNDGRGLINLIAFSMAVAAFEREQCAKICRDIGREDCANAILKRD